ncbi:mechanosensitive ion channel family protein [Glaciimonas soli]|uniref:Mechanosensitive ion channel n=1 Tax=Glaciimonas soli TaxID=2590999 RepID=A0A843YR26_9BURK|nr:mechanosensitive ion channel domain-containing protein [Glaciimonas soli]MQQ99962.1 mechanosensitive ion channel [Glaciimonas soli]
MKSLLSDTFARFFSCAFICLVACVLLLAHAPVAYATGATGGGSTTTPAAPPSSSVLSTLEQTLKSNPSTSALGASLQKATQPAATNNTTTNPANKGLIGLISNSLDSAQSHYSQVVAPQKYWSQQFGSAWADLSTLISRQDNDTPLRVLLHFVEMLILFGIVLVIVQYIGKRVRSHFQMHLELSKDPSAKELFIYILNRMVPSLLALLVVITVVLSQPLSLGRVLAVVLLYSLIGARLFRAICAIIFSLSHTGHRNVAINIIHQHGWKLLYAIGCAGFLGDGINNSKLSPIIGSALSSVVATLANLTAVILCCVFAIRFQRPVGQLIANRALEIRQNHRARIETLEIVASLWHWPVLILAAGVSFATLIGLDKSSDALNHALSSVALLIALFFVRALIQRIVTRKLAPLRAKRRPSPYIERILKAAFSLLQAALIIGFLELLTRIWSHSLLEVATTTALGQLALKALSKISLTLIVAWLVWIILDTAIQEAISPSRSSRRGRRASTRMRTILPLLRNAAMLTILTVTVITTLANLGINVTPLLASAGVVGIAVGFGSQSLIKDVITGIFILIEDSMSVGDWVDLGNSHAGTVEHLSIRTVRLRDSNGSVHSVPFSQIVAIRNDSRGYTYATLKLQVTLASSIDDALKLMQETGAEMLKDRRLKQILQNPIEVYGVNGFELNGINLIAGFRTNPQTQSEVVRAFNRRIKNKIDASTTVHLATAWENFPAVSKTV